MGLKDLNNKLSAYKTAQKQAQQAQQAQQPKSDINPVREADWSLTPTLAGFVNGYNELRRAPWYVGASLAYNAGQWGGNAIQGLANKVSDYMTDEERMQRYNEIRENAKEEGNTNLWNAMVPTEDFRKVQPKISNERTQMAQSVSNWGQEAAKAGAELGKMAERGIINYANDDIPNVPWSRAASGSGEKFAADIAQNLPQLGQSMVASAAATAATRSPRAAAVASNAIMGINIYGQTYGDLRAKGFDPESASVAASINAAVQTPLESLPVARIVKAFPSFGAKLAKGSLNQKKIFYDILTTAGEEGLTEFLQQYSDASVEDVAKAYSEGRLGKDFGNIIYENTVGAKADKNFDDAVYAGALGAVMGGGMHGLGSAANYAARKLTTPDQKMIDEEVAKEEARVAAEREQESGSTNIHPTANAVMQFFINKGESPEVAAAIAGNIAQESGYDPTVENSIGAYGLFQYLGERRDGLNAFAEANNLDPSDINTQLEYAWYEMNQEGTLENQALQEMRQAQTVEDAAVIFRRLFERPGEEEANDARRMEEARFVHDNYTGAKAYIEDYAQQMDLITEQDNELFATLNKLANEGTEEEVIKKAQELGYQPKVAEEETPTQEAPKETPKPTERPQGTAQIAQIETAKAPAQEAEAPKAEPIQGTPYHINNSTPTIKRSADKGNFNNRGSYNGRLAPQNVNNTVQTAGLPLSQPTQAILQGENQNAESLQTQTTERGKNRENTNVNAEPKQTIQNEGNENVTHSQGNEVTPTLAPSNQGTAGIAQNAPKTASSDNILTADKVDGKALEKATAANKDAVSAKSEADEAKAKENAVLDSDSTVGYFKNIVEEKVRRVQEGEITAKEAVNAIEGASKRTSQRLGQRYANGFLPSVAYEKLENRANEIKEEALSRIEQKEEAQNKDDDEAETITSEKENKAMKETTAETKQQEKKAVEAKEATSKSKTENQKTDKKEAKTSQEKPQKTKAQQKADTEKDAKAKRLLTKDAYDKVYTPLVNVLEQAQPEVAKAARDTALLMAKTADILHKRFKMKWENAPRVLLGGNADKFSYFQSKAGYEKNLVAMHNISVSALSKAIKLGGLPVPSIAITKKQTPYTEFGDVTLIMRKDVADPKKTPIYDRDAWTAVFPKLVRKGKRRKIVNFIEKVILPTQKEIPRSIIDYSNMYTPSIARNADINDLQDIVERFLETDGAQYLYLKSVEKAPKPVKTLNEKGISVIDYDAFHDSLKKKMSSTAAQKAFHEWQEKIKDELLEAPVIKETGEEPTLENITDIMLDGLVNEQRTFFGYGVGNAIAASAKQINTLEEMHRAADTKMEISEDAAKAYHEVRDRVTDFVWELSRYYKYPSDWDSTEHAAKVIGEMGANGTPFTKAAKKYGIYNAEALLDKANQIVEEIQNLKVNYFEGKPQRAVTFDEVAVAVLPKGTPLGMAQYLNQHGVKVKRYDPKIEGDRERVTNEAQERAREYFETINTETTEAKKNLEADTQKWVALVDEYRKTNKDEWRKYKNSKIFDFMHMPLVLQLIGYPKTSIKVYGSFFKHSINPKHPGMTTSLLKQLPKAMTDPMFICRGTAKNSVVMALELKDSRGATVVAVVEFSKSDKRYGIINLVTTAYSKNNGENKPLDYKWVASAFDQKNLLYINKKKSTAWIQGIRGSFPMGPVYLNGALSNDSIKTEDDFVKLKEENPSEYQRNKDQIAGLYNAAENLIKVFEKGNASTAVHESAHWYLVTLENLLHAEAEKRGITGTTDEILEKLAEDETMPKDLVSELQKIRNWAQYSEETMKEYEGTELEKEFAKLVEAIKNGDEDAKERFIQERFARGYERYLASGKAPAKELEGAFNRFRKWLLDIYRTIKNLGNKPAPKEIQEIFDRMLAMEEKPKPKKKYPTGKKTTLITDKGDEFSVTYKLMPVEDVITSNDANFGENANFPTELQPRDRDREGLKAQVRGIAEKINPRELTETIFPNQGAPVINEDNVAESGNGRTMALTMAYTEDGELYKKNADKYKSYLAEHAEDFGFTKEQVEAIDHPILVRQRTHESDRLQMDIVTSTRGGARLSAGQQARIDAKKISEDTLSLYRYDGSGNLTAAANRDFVVAFIDEVVDPNDRDVMQDKDGNLSGDGLRRIKLALCAKAYANSNMIDDFSESTDPEAKNFVEAYKIVAPRIAAVKNIIENGDVDESFDLPKLLDESLKFYLDSKKAGIPIRDALNQGAGLFKEGESQFSVPGSREFVEFLASNARKKKAVVDAMTEMAKGVTDIANNNKHDSLIEDSPETTLYDIVRMAVGKNASNFTVSEDGKTLTAKPDKWEAASEQKKENAATIAKGAGAEEVDLEKGIFTFPDEITREETSNIIDAEMDIKYSQEGNVADKLRSEAKMIPENELTEREKGIAAFARRMGVRVQFFSGNENLHGWQQGNVVFLNRNSAKDLNKVFWHEVFHWLAGNNPELYEKLKKAVLQNDDIAAQIEAYKEETGRTDLTTEEAIEEMLADAMMDASTRGKFFETLGVTHPTLVQKIIKWLKNTYNDLVAQFRRTKGFRPEAGLTNTQIKRMSASLDGMALKLKDGQGNRLFRADSKGNLVSVGVKDVAYVDGVKYLVTNKNLRADDLVPVVKIPKLTKLEKYYDMVSRVARTLKGQTFITNADGIKLKGGNNTERQHFASSNKPDKRDVMTIRKNLIATERNIKELLANSVYVEEQLNEHDNSSPVHMVQLFGAAEIDGIVYRVNISASKIADGTYEINEATLYNINTMGQIPQKAQKKSVVANVQNIVGRNLQAPTAQSNVSIADLLETVEDKNKNLYIKNGILQFEPKLLAEIQAEEKMKNSEKPKLSINLKDLSDGNVFSDEKRNKANTTILQKLEIGNDADVKAYLGRFIGQEPIPPKHPKVGYDDNAVNSKKKLAGEHLKYTLLGRIRSVSRYKSVIVNQVFNWADDAKRQQAKLYAKWTVAHKEILDLIQDPKDLEMYTAILLDEDSAKKVLTDKDLRERGASDNVIKAHTKIRKLLKEIRSEVAKVYTAERAETKNFSSQAEAEAWAKTPFFRNVDIKRIRKTNGVVWQVKYLTPQYETNQARMTVEELEGLKGNDEIKIISESLVDPNNPNYYDVEYMRPVRSLADIDFYIPHFFHDFLIVKKTMKNGEEIQNVVGSGTSVEEAVERANALAEKAGENDKFEIVPKALACEDETSPAVVVGDKEYGMLTNSIKEGLSVTLEEARDALAARTTNRHVFLSALQHRKGASGWETNLRWVIQHHIAASSRYCGLEPFKTKAINLFERRYGAFSDNYFVKNPEAAFVQDIANAVLGKPGKLETFTNSMLRFIPWFKDTPRPSRVVTSNILGAMSVFKLGVSPAAAVVNMTQLINIQAYLGVKWTREGMNRAWKMSDADLKLFEELGTREETGLETVDVDENTALVAPAYAKQLKAVRNAADKAMWAFTKAESFLRKTAVLGAYHKALAEGKTEGAARAYALEVNRNANFDYSVVDEPGIFRALKGTIIGDLFLQFKKYGLKELEVIIDMATNKNIPKSQRLAFFGEFFLLGGLFNSVPFQEVIVALIGMALDTDDPEAELKKWLMQKAGESEAAKEAVLVGMYGAGALIGMDISQRVGFRNLVPEFDEPLGVTGSTVKQIITALDNGDPIGLAKAVSPAAGNIASAIAGHNTDSKGRISYVYEKPWERVLRLCGFRTIGEALSVDTSRILTEGRSKRTKERDKAKEEYFKNPSRENKQKLKEFGYTDGQIKNLKPEDKSLDRKARLKKNMTKQELKDYKDILEW